MGVLQIRHPEQGHPMILCLFFCRECTRVMFDVVRVPQPKYDLVIETSALIRVSWPTPAGQLSTSGCPLWSTTSRLTTRPGLQSRGAWSAQWEWQCLDTGSHRPGADQGQEHPGRGGGAHGEQRTQHLGLLDGVSNEDVVTGDRQGASPECCYTIKFKSIELLLPDR